MQTYCIVFAQAVGAGINVDLGAVFVRATRPRDALHAALVAGLVPDMDIEQFTSMIGIRPLPYPIADEYMGRLLSHEEGLRAEKKAYDREYGAKESSRGRA